MNLTKAQAVKLLSVSEIKLFEDSRIRVLRTLAASQLDRRIARTRSLRDRARDLLQRQRLATQERTRSKRGLTGLANERSKQKVLVLTDILRRFEGQLVLARKAEQAGRVPTAAPKRRVTKAAAVARRGSRSAERRVVRNTLRDRAADAMSAASADSATSPKAGRTTTQTSPRRAAAKKSAATVKKGASTDSALKSKPRKTAQPPAWQSLGETSGTGSAITKEGYQSSRAKRTAIQRHFGETRLTAIQAHLSSQGRRAQGKRDQRGN